jgi:chromosome segregation ATPase
MSGKAKETASNTMEAIRDKMYNLKNAKEAAADLEKSLQNRINELNKLLETRDHEIIVVGKKIMKIENAFDDTSEKLEAATLGLEEAEKQELINEEEVSALQRRSSLLDDDVARSEGRLQVESTKLSEAAAAAEAVEIQRKLLESKSFINDERIDTLEENIATAREVALKSSRNAEEVERKLNMTQVEFDRTNEKCKEAEQKIDELEDQLNVVGLSMKTLELSETNALKRHEDAEEKIRDLTMNLKFAEIQAAAAEREAAKLQQELDLLVVELNDWKERYGEICVELEQTFNEMAGY